MPSLRTFYALLATQVISLIGSRMTGVAIGIQIFQDTGQSSPLLLAAFFAELPGMAGGSLTGLLADRWDRRRVIMLGDAGQALGTCLLLASFAGGVFELWHLYAVMLLQGIFATIQSPASQASITMLVPENHRDRANGLSEMGFPLAGVVAPLLAGTLYALVGVTGVMVVDLLTFLVAFTVVARITIPRPAASEDAEALGGSLWRDLSGGWRYLAGRRALLIMVLYLSFVFFLLNGPLELAIPYLISRTGSESTAGALMSLMSLGALAGAGAVAVAGRVGDRMRVILLGYLMVGVMLVAYGMAYHPVALGVILFVLFFPLPLAGALFTSLLQAKTPPDLQGRVFALTGQFFTLTTPFSFVLTGWLVDRVLEPAVGGPGWSHIAPLVGSEAGAGMGLLLVLTGALVLAATLLIAANPAIRHLERDLPGYQVGAEAATPPDVLVPGETIQPAG